MISPMVVVADDPAWSASSAPSVSGSAPRSCWVVIVIPVRIALQQGGVFTASARLRSRLPGILRYPPAAIRREDLGGFQLQRFAISGDSAQAIRSQRQLTSDLPFMSKSASAVGTIPWNRSTHLLQSGCA